MASKYDRIAADLRKRIASGDLVGQLPPETELATAYGVALNTLRRATDLLEAEGLLTTRPGLGTYVREPRRRIHRNHAERYQWEKDRARLSPDERSTTGATEHDTGLVLSDLSFQAVYTTVPATQELAERLEITQGEAVLMREYFTRATNERAPFNLVKSYLPYALVAQNPDLLDDKLEPWPGGTQNQLFTIGIELDRIKDEITARPPTAEEAEILDLDPGVSVIVLWKTSIDTTDRPVEVSEVILPGDRTQIDHVTKLKRWA